MTALIQGMASPVATQPQAARSKPGRVFNWVMKVNDWRFRQASRRQFKKLDSRLLEDIGISAQIADIESNKPFWRA